MTTNERIWNVHVRLDLTRKKFAERMGVSLDTVHAWFRPEDNAGYRLAPEMAARLAERL